MPTIVSGWDKKKRTDGRSPARCGCRHWHKALPKRPSFPLTLLFFSFMTTKLERSEGAIPTVCSCPTYSLIRRFVLYIAECIDTFFQVGSRSVPNFDQGVVRLLLKRCCQMLRSIFRDVFMRIDSPESTQAAGLCTGGGDAVTPIFSHIDYHPLCLTGRDARWYGGPYARPSGRYAVWPDCVG